MGYGKNKEGLKIKDRHSSNVQRNDSMYHCSTCGKRVPRPSLSSTIREYIAKGLPILCKSCRMKKEATK